MQDLELFQSLGGFHDAHVDVSDSEFSDALASCKRYAKLDIDGICVRAVALPSSQFFNRSVRKLLSCLLSSDLLWKDVSLLGFVKGKKKGNVSPGETRGMLPQTTLLQPVRSMRMSLGPPWKPLALSKDVNKGDIPLRDIYIYIYL